MDDIRDAGSKNIDMLKWCSAAALELIGQAGRFHLGLICLTLLIASKFMF